MLHVSQTLNPPFALCGQPHRGIPSGMTDTDMSESCELVVHEALPSIHISKQSAASLLQVTVLLVGHTVGGTLTQIISQTHPYLMRNCFWGTVASICAPV